jgi:hypothetical protein
VDPEGLRSALDSSWMELDADLHRWLQGLAREEGIN